MKELPTRLGCFLRQLLALPTLLFALPFLWLAARYRPLWRGTLRLAIALHLKRVMGCEPVLLLALDRQEQWARLLPLIESLANEARQMRWASAFTMVYFYNERFDEALASTDFWASIPAAWVREHPTQAREALRLHKLSFMWYPHGLSFLEPANVEEVNLSKQTIKSLAEIARLDGGMMFHWRDSRLMGEFLNWRLLPRESDEQPPSFSPRPGERRPLLPIGYESVNFPRIFMARAHLTRNDFKQMWRRATTLEA